MVITTDFIAGKFENFNKEYFGGKLHTPDFEVTHVKSYLGQYHWKYAESLFGGDLYDYDGNHIMAESIIRISDRYDRSETDICNTIIHEMIHLYIRQNGINDSRAHHGRVFKQIADRINRQGGWNIATTNKIAGCGLTDKTKDNKYYIACYYSGKSRKYFSFRINEKYLDYYKREFDLYPTHYMNLFVFVSNDDKKYDHYPKCHKGVRGYYISSDEYLNLSENENVIYRLQTLGTGHKAA